MTMKVQLNPNLLGFKCIRCGARYPVGDYFEGCSACAREGHAASLAAQYVESAPVENSGRMPLVCESYLGEGQTPLHSLDELASQLGVARLWAKLESANPTRSHKDRMSRYVVARAQQLGIPKVVAATSGNAGVSLAATAASVGMHATIVTRRGAPGRWVEAIRGHGAEVIECPDAASRWVEAGKMAQAGTHYPATNHLTPPVGSNPFGVQGYKSLGYELVAELGPEAVDAILVPTDRGDLLWGIYEGLREMKELGQLAKMPRLFATEPYPRIFSVLHGADYRESFPGISRQASVAGSTVTWQALCAVRASGGAAVVVDDPVAESSRLELARNSVAAELCSAASLGALRSLVADNTLSPGANVVLIITSDGTLF